MVDTHLPNVQKPIASLSRCHPFANAHLTRADLSSLLLRVLEHVTVKFDPKTPSCGVAESYEPVVEKHGILSSRARSSCWRYWCWNRNAKSFERMLYALRG